MTDMQPQFDVATETKAVISVPEKNRLDRCEIRFAEDTWDGEEFRQSCRSSGLNASYIMGESTGQVALLVHGSSQAFVAERVRELWESESDRGTAVIVSP